MNKSFLIAFMALLTDCAFAVCSSPISRSNFTSNQVLTSTRLNTDFNTAYTRLNELPGDCITDETITSAKIDDGTIVNADISSSAVIARTKLAALPYTISTSSSGSFSTSSSTLVDVTNLTASITTTGGAVEIMLIPSGTAYCSVNIAVTAGAFSSGEISFLRDATNLGSLATVSNVTGTTGAPGAGFRMIDFPAAGTYTYKAQAKVSGASATMAVDNCKLLVREF
jgi:hypothetical protein